MPKYICESYAKNVFVIGCAECSLYDYNLIRVLELRKLAIKVISLQYRVTNRTRTLHTKLLLPSSLRLSRTLKSIINVDFRKQVSSNVMITG